MLSRNSDPMRWRALALSGAGSPGRIYKTLNRSPGMRQFPERLLLRRLLLQPARTRPRARCRLGKSGAGDAVSLTCYRLESRGHRHAGRMWDLDIDLERRDVLAALHLNVDVVALDDHMLGDGHQDLLAQELEQVGLPACHPLVREQDLEPLARNHGRTSRLEPVEDTHAALRPNSMLSRPLRSLGMFIGTSSPRNRAAAS